MSSVIGPTDLEVGQWLQFTTEEDLSDSGAEKQAIYEENQRYLVICREDTFIDPCRCCVVDIDGKMYDYCARMFTLSFTFLWNSPIAVSRESVEKVHGQEKIQAVYQAAEKHIERMADSFAKYPGQRALLQNLNY